MATAIVLVCDECGAPATESFRVQSLIKGGPLRIDLCGLHSDILRQRSRPARRGRPRKLQAVA